MTRKKADFAIVGLGKMGKNLALQAMDKGFTVCGVDTKGADDELTEAGLLEAHSLDEMTGQLKKPRIVFLYIPAGSPIDGVIDQLAGILDKDDVIADGGNSYWGDSIRRHEHLQKQGLRFVDCGTSGGTDGARNGACFMVGGEDDAVALIEPIVTKLAVENGYVHAGPPGAGHFVKLVHNGIEFGMLQAIGEGMALLDRYPDTLATADVLTCWCNGSVIRSWLIELMEQQYRAQGGLEAVPPYVEDTGEVNWLVNDAMHFEVPTPVIAQSVMQLFASRDDDQPWARAIAMMRHGFGGHPFGSDDAIVRERREGRVGEFISPEKMHSNG